MKLTPTAFAALSNARANFKHSLVLVAAAIIAIGVTDILLFIIGIPSSPSISSQTETRFLAF